MKVRLVEARIDKYKSFTEPQEFVVEPDVTVLVGKNESGKTAILEALAKTRYMDPSDAYFKFDATFDYPRSELKRYQRAGECIVVVTCSYELAEVLMNEIEDSVGPGTLKSNSVRVHVNYKNERSRDELEVDFSAFLKSRLDASDLEDEDERQSITSATNLADLIQRTSSLSDRAKNWANGIKKTIENGKVGRNLDDFIYETFIAPNIPKFLYYDSYYQLPSRIDLTQVTATNNPSDEAIKTAKALLELADVNIAQLTQNGNFEAFIAELEATSNEITNQLFDYWTTNSNLEISFEVATVGNAKHLYIRVRDQVHRVSIPLDRRSKGFNWFFSFLVWFSKIQADKKSTYILLLDEPGLNLHASAQADLLRFINDLAEEYQVIYTTHSPFMIESDRLDRIRTVASDRKSAFISDSIQEKDPDTLFPLQAALGYDIAQNLFISKDNLLVEGPADLLYLSVMSSLLEQEGKVGLREGVTIVPVGGMDKVVSFISLLRGSKLTVVTLLDTFKDQSGKRRLDDLIARNIVKDRNVLFYHDFVEPHGKTTDVEDMFTADEYLRLFNRAFQDYPDIQASDLISSQSGIISQICAALKIGRFNHFLPARAFSQMISGANFLSKETMERFEKMYREINSRFN